MHIQVAHRNAVHPLAEGLAVTFGGSPVKSLHNNVSRSTRILATGLPWLSPLSHSPRHPSSPCFWDGPRHSKPAHWLLDGLDEQEDMLQQSCMKAALPAWHAAAWCCEQGMHGSVSTAYIKLVALSHLINLRLHAERPPSAQR